MSEEIKRERKIHKRQKWQHTFWVIVAGVAIGATVEILMYRQNDIARAIARGITDYQTVV